MAFIPLLHCDELPVKIFKSISQKCVSNHDDNLSKENDSTYQKPSTSKHPNLLTQSEVGDLVKDLNLQKSVIKPNGNLKGHTMNHVLTPTFEFYLYIMKFYFSALYFREFDYHFFIELLIETNDQILD